MNIWIFNHHALTPDMSGGTRHFDFAKELVGRGHTVTIFASSFHYAQHKDLKTYTDAFYLKETIEGVHFIWLKTLPYKGNGVKRVLNMLEYMLKAQKVVQDVPRQPDIIVGSSVHLFAVYAAYKVAKKLNVPFVMEVRDIWPQTLIDMGISKYHPFVLLLGKMEKFLYRKASKIITNLPYAYKHIEKFDIKREDIIWISNGVDITKSSSIEAYQYKEKSLNIVYAGALGQANQLNILLEAANKLQKEDIIFHIIGDGPMYDILNKTKTTNVIMYGALAKEKAIAMIKGADILFFPLADSPVFKFGISSNKLFDYLASRHPIIFASNAENNPIQEANAGLSISPENSDEIVTAIKKLQMYSPSQRDALGENGYHYVSKYFNIPTLVDKLEDCLSSLVYNAEKKRTT